MLSSKRNRTRLPLQPVKAIVGGRLIYLKKDLMEALVLSDLTSDLPNPSRNPVPECDSVAGADLQGVPTLARAY